MELKPVIDQRRMDICPVAISRGEPSKCGGNNKYAALTDETPSQLMKDDAWSTRQSE